MGKHIESFFVRYYRTGILITVLCSIVVFGTIAWNTSANSRENSTLKVDPKPTPEADRDAIEGEEGEPHRVKISVDRVEGNDEMLDDDTRDAPPDTKHYIRELKSADRIPLPRAPQAVQMLVVDTVVSNTNANLTNTDTAGDGETNIAINPANPNEVVITAFSGGWGTNTPLWHSLDGGATWTQQQTLPRPPGAGNGTGGCPCDQSIDYGRGNRMSGTVLSFSPTDVYSGTTTNPANSASWLWNVSAGTAVLTNTTGITNADQPWLLVNPDPNTPAQDNVYVAYDDFSVSPVGMQVARAGGSNPPAFTNDVNVGQGGGGINPGHRLAEDPNSGAIYSLFQRSFSGDDTFRVINYNLNRSTDGGATWTLNGSPSGIVVATADSTQPRAKFGTVNALLGGVDHAAVDPTTGDLYYVYGNRDSGTGNNRLAIRRITTGGGGVMTVGAEVFVNGQVQSAIPSVAVNSDGVIGVFYYTYNGIVGGFPQFTARVTFSTNQGASFSNDTALHTFASSAVDDGAVGSRQRVLGDYMQMKAIGKTFFGSYTGNGAQFGRAVSNHDPIFFKIALVQDNTTTVVNSSDTTTVFGEPVTFTATVTSAGGIPTGTVNFRDGASPIAACQSVALLAGVAQCQNVTNLSTAAHTINADYSGDVAFNSSSGSVGQTVSKASTTTTITADTPDPSVFGETFPVAFTVVAVAPGAGTPTGNVIVTVSGGAETCTGTVAAGTCNIQLNGVGSRTLTATYQSDTNFLGSNDTEAHQVDKANTTTVVTALPASPSVFGQSVTFTATVAAAPPGAGTPTGSVTFNIDGNLYCQNTALNGSAQATCSLAGLPALGAGVRDVVAIYNGNANFNGSAGDLNYTVNKANTTTTILTDVPDPSLVGRAYQVTWSVVPNPGQVNSGFPTGTVTVDGGTGGGTCTANVAFGGCQLTPTTVGVKAIAATYNGDANFNTSTSTPTTPHTVHVQISGVVRNGITLAPIANEPMTLGGAGCISAATTTNASGAYSFQGIFAGPCFVYPNSTYSEPFIRNYASVLANITNADFLIWANAFEFPRKLAHQTQYVVPGAAGTMPVILNSLDNEATLGYTITYDINPFAQPPVFICGANAPGCAITNNTTIFGRVGVTITPAGGVFTRPDGTALEGAEISGPKEIAKINFQTLGSATMPSTDFGIAGNPVAIGALDAASNDLLIVFVAPIRVVFAHGIEGDVAGRNAGSGVVDAADVVQVRNFVTGLNTPVGTHNEFQRADTAPASTKGDGTLNATDVIQVRRYGSGLDTAPPAGGNGAANPAPVAPPPALDAALGIGSDTGNRSIRLGSANASGGSRVSIPVELTANGDEVAASFTVRYDDTRLANARVDLAKDAPEGMTLTVNTDEPGLIRILVDSTTAIGAAKDAMSLLNITFDVTRSAPSGDTSVEIADVVISDGDARSLPTRANAGILSISASDQSNTAAKRLRLSTVDLVEEWLGGSAVILRPRLVGETSVPLTRPVRQKDQ